MATIRKNKLAMGGLIFLILLDSVCGIWPDIFTAFRDGSRFAESKQSTFAEHWFGTDEMGRDVFTRTWYGAVFHCLSVSWRR